MFSESTDLQVGLAYEEHLSWLGLVMREKTVRKVLALSDVDAHAFLAGSCAHGTSDCEKNSVGPFGAFGRSSSFSSNGLDIGCPVKRLLGQVRGPIVQFLFLLCLLKESKFNKDVSSSVVWLGL